MSAMRTIRDLPQSTSLENVSSSSATDRTNQNAKVPTEVRTAERYDPRTSGATKEAVTSKLSEQKMQAQAQYARLQAVLPRALPDLPLIDGRGTTLGFGKAPTGTMPIGHNNNQAIVGRFGDVNYSKLSSMPTRELQALEAHLSQKISDVAKLLDKLITLKNVLSSHNEIFGKGPHTGFDDAIAQLQQELAVLKKQHHLVEKELERRNDD